MRSYSARSASGLRTSSPSMKKTYGARAASSPRLRAADGPAFPCDSTEMRGSSAAQRISTSSEASVEPSLTQITSSGVND